MRVEAIDNTSVHLRTVKTLGKANAQTLGFFPEGAFDQYAQQRTILVALDGANCCVGYVLYRVTYGEAIIVHLCVAEAARGQKIARQLLNHLCEITRNLHGVRANCRWDYEANRIWPHLGFRAIGEHPGRAKQGSILTEWWLDYGHPDLFSYMAAEQLEPKLSVAIDANIFYDLTDPTRPDREEAEALLADWLSNDIELSVSDELWNEINRSPDKQQRQRDRIAAARLKKLSSSRASFEAAYHKLRPFFPQTLSDHDAADLRQLAHALAADVRFFITRDTGILDQADKVYNLVGMSILRPSDLLVRFDELRREAAYQPARLAGTLMELRRVQSGEQDILTHYFYHEPQEESRADFGRRVRRYLTKPKTCECMLAIDDNQVPMALIVYDEDQRNELRVPVFRVRSGILAATLARHIIQMTLARAAEGQRQVTCFTDPYLPATIGSALQEYGFTSVNDEWWKISMAVAEPSNAISLRLHALGGSYPSVAAHAEQLANILAAPDAVHDPIVMTTLEQELWPAKITDAAIPTFLVPIKPYWAQELFDTELANQTLLGTTKRLVLNREAVYYRSYHNHQTLTAPGRILWYVSKDKNHQYQGTGAIRACSRLEEVITGLPKNLFRRFRRLGIYEWKHVYETANKDVNQPIMALRFSDTELFKCPITLDDLRNIYQSYDLVPALQSPTRLASPELFTVLYRQGKERSRN